MVVVVMAVSVVVRLAENGGETSSETGDTGREWW